MQNLKDEVIEIVRRKSKAEPEAIDAAVNEAETAIRNYCGRWTKLEIEKYEELPYGLLYIWANMAVGIININSTMSSGDTGGAAVTSIKEGDTTVQFSSGVTYGTVTDLVNSFSNDLNRYRRLYPNVKEGVTAWTTGD